jgi:serine protease Do
MRKLIIIMSFAILFTSHSTAETDLEYAQIQLTQKALQSTVRISPSIGEHGSGFFVGENTVITNYHVIKNNYSVSVEKFDGSTCKGSVGYREDSLDLAIVKVDCTGTPLKITNAVAVGQSVLAVGNPSIYDFHVTRGIVSGEKWQHVLFDASVYNGNSGGPLVNSRGEVIGVVMGRDKEHFDVGAAVSGKETLKFLERAK